MTIQNRITLKNIKVVESCSEETLFFRATVYFDGKRIALAENDGRGASTFLHAEGKNDTEMKENRLLLKEAEKFAASLPPRTFTSGGKDHELTITLDFLIEIMVDEHQKQKFIENQFKRTMKYLVIIKDGTVIYFKGLKMDNMVKTEQRDKIFSKVRETHGNNIVILNELSEEQALAEYQKALSSAEN